MAELTETDPEIKDSRVYWFWLLDVASAAFCRRGPSDNKHAWVSMSATAQVGQSGRRCA